MIPDKNKVQEIHELDGISTFVGFLNAADIIWELRSSQGLLAFVQEHKTYTSVPE